MNKIKQIRTVTLSKNDSDCATYDDAINFLSNILINQRDGHFHYIRRNVNLIGRTLVLFKYEGRLIAKGIFYDEVTESVNINNVSYNGYYLVEKDSIGIFTDFIERDEIKKHVPTIKSMNRDQVIDIKYLDEINSMIEKHLEGGKNNQYDLSAQIIRSYLDENDLGSFENQAINQIQDNFNEQFGPVVLEKLEGVDIINKIFLHDGDKSTLCYNLEFSPEFMRGGIGGGSALKYSLYKASKTNQWTTGAPHKQKTLTEDEAIELGSKIRDAILAGARHIENTKLDSVNDYLLLEKDLNEIFSNCAAKPTSSWIHKYYVLLFPDKFPEVHGDAMRKYTLQKFRIEPEKGYYVNDGQYLQLAKKAGIKLHSLLNVDIIHLFFEGDPWDPIEKGKLIDLDECKPKPHFISSKKRNIIYFGAPGTGKSYNLNQDIKKLIDDDTQYERVTFHPDYAYANFVGTYKPVPDDNSITYKYVPGPFMRSLVKAYKNPDKPFVLIIEEINRANVAAVFGDVFQLLDRKDNVSEYPIHTSEDMKEYLKNELNLYETISIPQNMFIWATMNSADQGVFPMDTAFKRRWDFKYFSINNNQNLIKDTHVKINDKTINWNDLRNAINHQLLSYKLNEDKLIGPFFAFNDYHNKEIPIETFKDIFKNKIIMYLFEDAARPKRNELFSGACEIKDTKNITYSQICDLIDSDKIIEIFTSDIRDKFYSQED